MTTDIKFPFPILTELGTQLQTETEKDISIDSENVTVLAVSGTISPQSLNVIIED